jgi:hypothetical protein
MNFDESFFVFISVQTSNGHRYLYYTADNLDYGMSSDNEYIHHGLGTATINGSWQIFTRNLDADLKEFESTNQILSINAFLIRGSGLLDNIKLSQ